MTQPDENPNALKDRHWFNSIHEARIEALQTIRNAGTVRHLGGRSDQVAHMKQAHSATVSFFLELEPSIQTSPYGDQYLQEVELGTIKFHDIDESFPITGFSTYAKLDNPVEVQRSRRQTGMLGSRDMKQTSRELIPLPVIITAYRHLRLFAHEFNLTRSEQEQDVHGEPF